MFFHALLSDGKVLVSSITWHTANFYEISFIPYVYRALVRYFCGDGSPETNEFCCAICSSDPSSNSYNLADPLLNSVPL